MKKILFTVLYRFGVTRLAAWWHRKRVTILCYHGVTEQPANTSQDPKGLHVNHLRFAAHLDFLQRNYNVVSLSDYLIAHNEGRSRRHCLLVENFPQLFF